MKHRIIKLSLLLTVFALAVSVTDAQSRRRKPHRSSKKRTAIKKNTVKDNSENTAALTPPKDTVKPVVQMEATLKLDTPRMSLRNDYAIERNLVKDRTPLTYENIREDDAVYTQRVWREIDVHEKMNLPFDYKGDGDGGDQRFITILLRAIKSGDITAFDPIDDRFTTPMTFQQIAENLVGKPKSIQIPNLDLDPDGSKGIMKDTIIQAEFNPDEIDKYWIKEDWIFDKESSRMFVRILGIAPVKTIYETDGSVRGALPIFWVYYPDLRPMLAKTEVYNSHNFGARMSWEELFESRMFASRIIKSTIDNPNDQYISQYVKDPILALMEGEHVKEKIFNYEQDLWSY